MTRPVRVALISGGSFIVLLLLVVVAGVSVIRSQWFHDQVRNRIVGAIETATGGRAEIESFNFDWHTMTATIRGFTIHGTEPANRPPLLHADDIVVGLKIVSLLKQQIDVALVRIDSPNVFLLVDTAGNTNVPRPKIASKSNKSGVETILDLAIFRFELNNGSAQIEGAGQPPQTEAYNAQGSNLRALFTYDTAVPRYHGDLSIAPLNLVYGEYKPIQAGISTTVSIEKNQIIIEKSSITDGDSRIEFNGKVENFNAPLITAEYKAKVSLVQAGDILKLRSKQSGWIEATGTGSYRSANDFALHGAVKAYEVGYRAPGIDLRNIRAQVKIDGGPESISFNEIRALALGGEITGKAVLEHSERFKVNADLHHFDVRQLAALATRQKLPYDGVLNGPLQMEGRVSDLKNDRFTASTKLSISPAVAGVPLRGVLNANFNGIRNTLDLSQSFIALPNTRLDLSGTLGKQMKVRLESSNLNDLLPALQTAATPGQPAPAIPLTVTPQGDIVFEGVVDGQLSDPVLSGHLGGTNFITQSQRIDALELDVRASKTGVAVTNGRLRQNPLTADFEGSLALHDWKAENNAALTGSLGLRNASLQSLLAMAGQKNVAASGTLNANAKINGTLSSPQASADLNLTRGDLQGEPFDRLNAHVDAPNRTTQSLTAQLSAGQKQINLTASYAHSTSEFVPGRLTFNVKTNNIAMNQVVTLHHKQPNVSGTAKITADGIVDVTRDKSGTPAVAVAKINADVSANAVQIEGRQLGNVTLTANTVTENGPAPVVQIKLRSDLARAIITGDGSWTLAGDYPGSAKLQFSKVDLDTVRRLVLSPQEAESVRVGGSVEGTLDVSGPAAKPEQLRASLTIPKLELHPMPGTVGAPAGIDLSVHNAEPIRLTLANSIVRVESAHIIAQESDFSLRGRATLAPQPDLNMRVSGNINLGIIHLVNNDVISSGGVIVDASVRGTFADPQLNGSLQLKNATLALADVPNGLSNANGTIAFTGNQASIQSLTAESGGGKVNLAGFVALAAGNLTFRLSADANGVRVRYPQGVSTVADAQLSLVGSSQRSILSGTITIDRLAFNPRTDLGSILSSGGAPPETPSAQAGFTSNMQFDVQIETSPDITFQSSYTESVAADASLRLRGTISNPVLLGRVNVTQGDLTFFGNKYTINQGSISFFNPVKLEPILNIDLETVARGVDVTITVSGPITKLNVSYRSDPPLQFSDIVALLATGRTPNDASIAARQPTAPQQSWQQMGASALVGQAIANPVAGRLQRFFGVSKLKIDPTISGATGNPQAKVTLEQQITPDITFTYITDVANAQEQVIRVEWAFSPMWSVVALRDENGVFGVDFLYKKRFR